MIYTDVNIDVINRRRRELLLREQNSRMFSMSDGTGVLNESAGIKLLDDEYFNRELKSFINGELQNIISNVKVGNVKIDGVPGLFKKATFGRCRTWFGTMNVFVQNGGDVIDAFLLCEDGSGEAYDYTIDGKRYASFSMCGSHVKKFSIVLIVPSKYTYSVDEIYKVLMHEIQHAFRVSRKSFINNPVNADITFFGNKADTLQKRFRYSPNYESDDYLVNTTKISHMDIDEIYYNISTMIYYLNLSEIEARRVNFIVEVLPFVMDIENVDEFNEKFNAISQAYRIYNNIKDTLEAFKSIVAPDVKRSFVQKYIREFEEIYHNTDEEHNASAKNNRIVSFKHFGEYDAKSFDYLMDFFINRIKVQYDKRAVRLFKRLKDRYL